MTTFIQRCIGDVGDESDGSTLDVEKLRAGFAMYVLRGAQVIPLLHSVWETSAGQNDELAELLATKPTGIVESAAWAQLIMAAIIAGQSGWGGFQTADECRAQIGLSVP